MEFLTTLLAFCCIVFCNGTPILSNVTLNLQKTDKVITHNQWDNTVQFDETDLNERLGIRSDVASLGEFPFMVSIQVNGRHYCGGSLVSSQHVLTAGHCVYRFINNSRIDESKLTIEVGSIIIGSGISYKWKRLACTEHSMHETPNKFWPDDIAMITLLDNVTFSEYVKYIRLPPPHFDLPVGTKVTIPGYGSHHRKAPTSSVMKKTFLYTTTNQDCDDFFQRKIRSRQICVIRGKGYGTCGGDSGGPLVYNKQVVGVVSGGSPMCCIGKPDVFVNVSYFLPFIEYEMGIRSTYDLDSVRIIYRDSVNRSFGKFTKVV